MVERITLFEPHLEGSQFGPQTEEPVEESTEEAEEASGGFPLGMVFLALVVSLVVTTLVMRRSSESDDVPTVEAKEKVSLPFTR